MRNRKTTIREINWSGWPLVVLLGLSFTLRLVFLGSDSYFNDELSAICRAQETSFSDFLQNSVIPDFHPAGVQWFLWKWISVFGTNACVVRLPFALAGVLAVVFMFLLGKIWIGEQGAWLAASALATLQFPVYFSRIARPYSTGLLFVLMTAYFLTLLATNENLKKHKKALLVLAAGISCSLAMYNHYFSFFTAGIIGISSIWMFNKRTFLPYLTTGILACLFFAPHVNISIIQLSRGGLSSWLPPPDVLWLNEHALYLFNNNIWILLLFMALSVFLWGRAALKSIKKKPLIYSVWGAVIFLVSLIFAFFYSILFNPIIQHSIMLFSFPFLLLALFGGAGQLPAKWFNIIGFAFPLILSLNLTLSTRFYSTNHHSDFRKNCRLLCNVLQKHPNTVWVAQVNDPCYIHHYLDQMCTANKAISYYSADRDDLKELNQKLAKTDATNLAFVQLRPFDPLMTTIIRKHFPYLKQHHTTNFLDEFYHFSKDNNSAPISEYLYDTTQLSSAVHLSLTDTIFPHQEYFDIYQNTCDKIFSANNKPQLINCAIEGKSELPLKAMSLVITVETEDGITVSWNNIPCSFFDQYGESVLLTTNIPPNLSSKHSLKVFLWNPGNESYCIENYTIQLITSKSD